VRRGHAFAMRAMLACALLLASRGSAYAFTSLPQGGLRVGAPRSDEASRLAVPVMKKKWDRRKTLAETVGGASEKGASAVGLVGTISVEFEQDNATRATKAIVGQPLGDVAAQAGQFIKYQCRKGECGTCAVRVDGQWIRTCSVKVPHVPEGETYKVWVRPGMKKTKKASRFYSPRSIIDGFRNNLLGMFGFVREGRRSQANFVDRLSQEEEILRRAKAKKAAREQGSADET